jgi:hypothetical protein
MKKDGQRHHQAIGDGTITGRVFIALPEWQGCIVA